MGFYARSFSGDLGRGFCGLVGQKAQLTDFLVQVVLSGKVHRSARRMIFVWPEGGYYEPT